MYIKENIHKRWMEHFQLSGDVNFTRFETISCILWDKGEEKWMEVYHM